MGQKASAPPPPDYGPLAAASERSAELAFQLGRDQLAWAKEQFSINQGTTESVIDAALGRLDREDENAQQDRARYETIFQPLEDSLAKDAASYASPERMEREAGKAEADVAQQFEQARNTAQEKLEDFGVDYSQTRQGALDFQSRIAEAAAQASAGNQARDRTEQRGMALRSEAINIGKGYPGQIAQSYGTAGNSGNQAVNSGLATTQSGVQSMGSAPQWQALGNNALGTWGNAMNMGYQNQLDAWKANNANSSGLGAALGTIGGLATKFMGFAEGGAVPDDMTGAIPELHAGVPVPPQASPTGGGAIDDVPARLNVGEFIIPADAARWYGEEKLQKFVEKAREAKANAKAQPTVGQAPVQQPTVNTGGAIPA